MPNLLHWKEEDSLSLLPGGYFSIVFLFFYQGTAKYARVRYLLSIICIRIVFLNFIATGIILQRSAKFMSRLVFSVEFTFLGSN